MCTSTGLGERRPYSGSAAHMLHMTKKKDLLCTQKLASGRGRVVSDDGSRQYPRERKRAARGV